MKPPQKVKITPYTYTVRWDKVAQAALNAASFNGQTLNDSLELLIANNLPPGTERDIVLHECLHALWSQTDLAKRIDHEGEESVIWSLTPRLLGLLRDNPALVAYLVEKP